MHFKVGMAFRGRHLDLWYFEKLPPTARKCAGGAS